VIIHGPSVGIGAGIAAVVITAVFFGFSSITNQPEIALEPAEIPQPEASDVTLSVFTANASPILGSVDAPITLVEFGDYQCFFCNKFFHDTEEELFQNYVDTGKVKVIFKDFTIIGPDSINAAHGAHCANEQEKFWEYHDILYNNWDGENNGWAASENLLGFAQEINLDIDEWSQCMLDERHQQKITSSNNDARTLGLTGTPGFFVIGPDNYVTKIGGAQPYEVFEQIFESELAK
jgi:protein-disulfide isomerase